MVTKINQFQSRDCILNIREFSFSNLAIFFPTSPRCIWKELNDCGKNVVNLVEKKITEANPEGMLRRQTRSVRTWKNLTLPSNPTAAGGAPPRKHWAEPRRLWEGSSPWKSPKSTSHGLSDQAHYSQSRQGSEASLLHTSNHKQITAGVVKFQAFTN